jgi:predicted nucleic acid-binding protein
MSDKAFFDTNILVYAFDQSEPEKGEIARKLIYDYGCQGNLILSTQVLQEFYVATTRMGKKMLSLEDAEEIVNDFAEYPLIQIDRVIISRAMKRHQSKNFSFWDSLIVEAALESGATTLFSEDMHNGLVIGSLTICNPFSCV